MGTAARSSVTVLECVRRSVATRLREVTLPPLFYPGETASKAMFSVLGCPVQDRKGVTGQKVQRIF